MGIIKMLKDTKRAFLDASAPDPEPARPKQRREPTEDDVRRSAHLLNECVTVEGFVRYSERIDALPGDTAVAVVSMADRGCFLLIGGEEYGYLWDPKPRQLGLKDGERVTVEVMHNHGEPNTYAQLFVPKER